MRGLDLRNAALRRSLSTLAAGVVLVGASIQVASADANDDATMTAIKHVIVVIGENRTFDHVFATYELVNKGETVLNLLSEGIVKPDGSPAGPNYGKALQYRASDTTTYELAPLKAPYTTLPPALVGGPTTPYVCEAIGMGPGRHATRRRTKGGRQTGERTARGLSQISSDGRHGSESEDARSAHLLRWARRQPSSARPLSDHIGEASLDAYDASPVHRFFQMAQELDCNAAAATSQNTSGCAADLFPWVETSVGAGSNGKAQPPNFADETTGEGSTSMGFYNVHEGDAPYLKHLADAYTMSDNYHQPLMGGTGANHIMMALGAPIWFSDGQGDPA